LRLPPKGFIEKQQEGYLEGVKTAAVPGGSKGERGRKKESACDMEKWWGLRTKRGSWHYSETTSDSLKN
jgi:hypothetical protein